MQKLFLKNILFGFLFLPISMFVVADDYYVANEILIIDMQKKDSGTKYYPWLEPSDELKKQGVVLTAFGGYGFANITYGGYKFKRKKSTADNSFTVQQELSSNGIGDIYDKPSLLVVREWKGVKYVIDSAPLYVDAKKRFFIANKTFIEDHNLKKKVKDLPYSFESSSCERSDFYSKLKIEIIIDDNYGVEIPSEQVPTEENLICYNRGVLLSDL